MAAWGVVVPPGKTVPFVPPPDGGRLHLSQATLVPPASADTCGRALLYARAGEHSADVAIASLRGDGKGAECVGLDLIFDEYTEFRIDAADGRGGAPCVHLAGYHLPDFGDDGSDGDDESDDDEVLGSSDEEEAPLGVPIEDASLSDDDSEEDSDALSESDDEEQAAARAAQGVVIEELPTDDKAAGKDGDESGSDASGSDESGSDSDASSDGGAASSDDEADADAPVAAPEWGGKRKAGDAGGPPAKKEKAAAPATPAPSDAKKPAAPPPAAKKDKPAPAPAAKKDKPAPAAPASKVRRYDNGFVVEELAAGRPTGKRVTPGARVDVRYVGKLAKSGKVFDATKGSSTFSFRCGVGEVIKAWDRGVAGAVEGAKLRITAPPSMAYGASGVRGAIPGNATLVFDVEVVRVR